MKTNLCRRLTLLLLLWAHTLLVSGQDSFNYPSNQSVLRVKPITYFEDSAEIQPLTLLLQRFKIKDTTLQLTCHADFYYRYSGNLQPIAAQEGATPHTQSHNRLNFNLFNVQLLKTYQQFSFVADIVMGQKAKEINYLYQQSKWSLIKELYASYQFTPQLKLSAGHFLTHFGYEAVEAIDNFNYSTSYGYTFEPYQHTGFKMDYQWNPNWTLMLGIFNRNDTKAWDKNPKYIGGQLQYKTEKLKTAFNFLTGRYDNGAAALRQVEITSTYQWNTQFGLGFNWGRKVSPQEGLNHMLSSTALYANYQFKPNKILAARAEYFTDPNGSLFTAFPNADLNLKSFTLSYNLTKGSVTLIPEIRYDVANKAVFKQGNHSFQNQEISFLMAALYKF